MSKTKEFFIFFSIKVITTFFLLGITNIKFDNKTQTWAMEALRNGSERVGTCDECKSPFGANTWQMPTVCDEEGLLKLTKVYCWLKKLIIFRCEGAFSFFLLDLALIQLFDQAWSKQSGFNGNYVFLYKSYSVS